MQKPANPLYSSACAAAQDLEDGQWHTQTYRHKACGHHLVSSKRQFYCLPDVQFHDSASVTHPVQAEAENTHFSWDGGTRGTDELTEASNVQPLSTCRPVQVPLSSASLPIFKLCDSGEIT